MRGWEADLYSLENQILLFEESPKEKKARERKISQLRNEIDKLRPQVEEIESGKIYHNAFEWRFEFPEVLDDKGDFIGFDVIIGNPPYVFGGNEGISVNEKALFKQNFKTGSGKVNLFTLFIEKGFDLLRAKGMFSSIIPNTFLRVTSYHESRKIFIENHAIFNIYDFGDAVFDDAVTTAVVLVAKKQTPSDNHKIVIFSSQGCLSIEQKSLQQNNFVITTNVDDQKRKLIGKLQSNSLKLGTICQEMIFGVVITKNKSQVVSNNPIHGWQPFLEGKDIGAYYIKPIHSYLNYNTQLLHRPRTREIFEAQEKLLIQRITGGFKPLKVAYDNNQYYNKESINNLILSEDTEYNILYVLGLLNSKLINWFYVNQFTNKSQLTVNISKQYLSQLPVFKALPEQQFKIINLVNSILEIKKVDFSSNITELEHKIDKIVYELYGLSEEEIRIVEGEMK